jgi:hypothetical protein
MPRISIIVPLYNKAGYIARCLDAILGQSFQDFEVIVVNDGSTDGSVAIVERRQDARVRLVSQKNAGPGAARNHGVRLAQSPLVAFLDADDAWTEDYLEESVAAMARAAPDVASLTWGMRIYPRGESTERRWRELGIPAGVFRAGPATAARIIVAMLANMLPSSTVMRKSIFEELGGYYAKYRCVYSEDAWLYLKSLLRYAAVFDPRPLTLRFEDASELATNLKGVRPIEPFLEDPESLERDCPLPMRPLLREVLARRALKTASVYGYWGENRQSRRIVGRFISPEDWRLPYFFTAMMGCTPLGGWAGRLARAASRVKG